MTLILVYNHIRTYCKGRFILWRMTVDAWRLVDAWRFAWRMTVRLTQGSFYSEFACVKMRVVLRRDNDNWANTVLYIIVRTGPKVELAHKSRALLYSDLLRQTNRHASNKPSCVKRIVMRQANRHASTVMRQPSEYEINSTVSLFLLFGPSCVKVWIGLKA